MLNKIEESHWEFMNTLGFIHEYIGIYNQNNK